LASPELASRLPIMSGVPSPLTGPVVLRDAAACDGSVGSRMIRDLDLCKVSRWAPGSPVGGFLQRQASALRISPWQTRWVATCSSAHRKCVPLPKPHPRLRQACGPFDHAPTSARPPSR
jgi:hypothetical protein